MTGINGNTPKRDRIGMILYVIYLLLLLASLLVIGKIVYIQLSFNPDPKIADALKPRIVKESLTPERGNIIDCNGRLLAMSCPAYQIYMDCTVQKERFARMKDRKKAAELEAEWMGKAKELSRELARVFPEMSAAGHLNTISEGRRCNRKYVKIGHPVDRNVYNEICGFPLFREGRYKSGMIAERHNVRKYPYGDLARRTVGFVRDNRSGVGNTHVGIEGKFDYELHGTDGVQFTRHTDYGSVRCSDSTYRKAVDGNDIRTTLNIDYQKIADDALRAGISEEMEVEGGCLVLMEVRSGAIRAMVNLLRNPKTGKMEESYNMAIGRRGEPGSVFKTVTLMSVLADGYVRSLDERISTNHGIVEGAKISRDQHIVDYEKRKHANSISILDGFKMSSNYVFATLAIRNYGGKSFKEGIRHFLGNIYSYKLGDRIDFDLDGMASPEIPSPDSRYLTPTDLGCIGYGYTTGETPLQILTFYNAIAAKGNMMKPYLVERIEKDGKTVSRRGPAVLSASICTKAVADTLNRALETVTEEGTASRLKDCRVAGKTGTARIVLDNGKYTDVQGRWKNQGTFVGYFPSDDPQYSIICTIYSTLTNRSFYGGTIPAGAVKTVVEKIYTIDPRFREVI